MSWLYSQALVEAYLEGSSSAGRQYVASKLTRTGRRRWPHGRTTARLKPSRFGTISARSTGGPGEALLTWFREVSRARTSARRDTEPALTEVEAGFGERWHALFVRFDQDTYSWRTHGCLFNEVLPESSVSLPQWGLMRDGVCWELSMSAQTTNENAPGLWPTPTATLGSNGGAITPQKAREGGTLIEAVSNRMWPTPTVFGNNNRSGASEKSGDGLATAVYKQLFPTPTATNTKANHMRGADKGKTRESRNYLATPTARDYRSGKASQATLDKNSRPLSEQIGGSLNPRWVEWLMGWPIGWTSLEPSAMDKYRDVWPKPGAD